MDSLKAKTLASELNELACKGCTEGWLGKHDGKSDPIQDIIECFGFDQGSQHGFQVFLDFWERFFDQFPPDELQHQLL